MASRDSGPRGQAQWAGYWGAIVPDLATLNARFAARFPDATEQERQTAYAAGYRAISERNALENAELGQTIGSAIGAREEQGTIRVRALFASYDAQGHNVGDFSVVSEFAQGTSMADVFLSLREMASDRSDEYGDDDFGFLEFIVTVQ